MEQKEHIATLCALGTVGAAAAGLAFGTNHTDTHPLHPGKRKWPGTSASTWVIHDRMPPAPRRSISQPITPTILHNSDALTANTETSSHAPQSTRRGAPVQEDNSLRLTSSRASSTSRRSAGHPRAATARSSSGPQTTEAGSNWLKRLSSFSTYSTSSALSVKFSEKDASTPSSSANSRPATGDRSIPNKLVKRSFSQRSVSHDEARGQIFRRPATSHQRSQTLRTILGRPVVNAAIEVAKSNTAAKSTLSEPIIQRVPQSLRPYLGTTVPRKRRKSESAADPSQIRTVVLSPLQIPWLTLAHDLLVDDALDDVKDRDNLTQQQRAVSAPTKKTSRSFSTLRRATRRRNVTDPAVQMPRTATLATTTNATQQSRISPVSQSSTFEITLPKGTPVFDSSPPPKSYDFTHSAFNPCRPTAPSEHTTGDSDVDVPIFSDDESSELKSDTAYDSVATRTTNASNAVGKGSNLDNMFTEGNTHPADVELGDWDHLAESDDHDQLHRMIDTHSDTKMHGMGISIVDARIEPISPTPNHMAISTPPGSASLDMDDLNETPLPFKTSTHEIASSPPLQSDPRFARHCEEIGDMLDDMDIDDDDIDWSPKSSGSVFDQPPLTAAKQQTLAPSPRSSTEWHAGTNDTSGKRHSIFDYSEHHNIDILGRPKTVHGKQGDTTRSRTSGRKSNPQLHFRSQSVPVNRDGPPDDLAVPSKFATWKLGHTRVTEEWSDDFEFDDDTVHPPESQVEPQVKVNKSDSVKSVKIPQTIIDKQPSVHLQFGQVQEFMLLVEELKRLRLAGAKLQLLSGTARKLWEDAESIINLATINDDEENVKPLGTSAATQFMPLDEFSDGFPTLATNTPLTTASNRARRQTTGRRSVSDVKTPLVTGRTRGESIAQTQHFLHAMHKDRTGFESSPRAIEIHHEKKTPFDTQDLKDLVIRSGAITRQLKEEIRRADPVSVSPHKTPTKAQALENMFRAPDCFNGAGLPVRAEGLPHSRSANGYFEQLAKRNMHPALSSPISHAVVDHW